VPERRRSAADARFPRRSGARWSSISTAPNTPTSRRHARQRPCTSWSVLDAQKLIASCAADASAAGGQAADRRPQEARAGAHRQQPDGAGACCLLPAASARSLTFVAIRTSSGRPSLASTHSIRTSCTCVHASLAHSSGAAPADTWRLTDGDRLPAQALGLRQEGDGDADDLHAPHCASGSGLRCVLPAPSSLARTTDARSSPVWPLVLQHLSVNADEEAAAEDSRAVITL